MGKPIILFESYPDFSGSSLEIYNELVKRGYRSKYDLLWAVHTSCASKAYPTIKYFGATTAQQTDILNRTKVIIDSNRYIHKQSNNYRLHVRHGCSFKLCTDYYNKVGNVDAILTTSNAMKQVDEVVWPSNLKGKFIVTGLPSNDRLFHPKDLYSSGFIKRITGINNQYDKIISWLPTYRQHRFIKKDENMKYPFGIPLIKSKVDLDLMNKILCDRNMLLIIQMHHAQMANYTKIPEYTNIKVISEADKQSSGLLNNDILGNCDAMITDYSAAYHEYIMLNRPIALTCDDLVTYAETTGFCYNYLNWIKGEPCVALVPLLNFIVKTHQNIDTYYNERTSSLHKIHTYVDALSTNRVVQYLITHKAI